ncbi:hypothetical protein JHK82_038659 [Glycine max]|nr:hypothetical protein JHK86_038835 [Glycine max]KAG5109436.1 hypothetical protein JHK82_038659 [Glycine max]KAG5120720.1 hypothetical protein JHK84_039060 [Glycine max]
MFCDGGGDDDSEVAATAKVEETEGGDKDYSLSRVEYLENDGVDDGCLKIQSFPAKRPRHLLQPQLALLLLFHQTLLCNFGQSMSCCLFILRKGGMLQRQGCLLAHETLYL